MSASPTPGHLGPTDLAVAAVMNLLWGLNIIAVKMAVDATAPFTAALLRMAIVGLICLPALRIVPGQMVRLLLLGLLNGGLFYMVVNFSLLAAENVSALAIASQLGAPFSLILAILFLGERVHWPRMVGMALAFTGVVILVFDPEAAREVPGLILTAVGSLIWSIGSLIMRGLRGVPVMTIYAWMGLLGSMLLLPLCLWMEPQTIHSVPAMRLKDFGWIAFSAIGSTLAGHGGMAWLLQRHPVSVVTPLTLASPIIAVVAAALFFGTPLTPLMIVGGLVAITGVAIITVRSAKAV